MGPNIIESHSKQFKADYCGRCTSATIAIYTFTSSNLWSHFACSFLCNPNSGISLVNQCVPMLVLENPFLSCKCSHIQHIQILLFGTHNPNPSCGRTHCFSSKLFSFAHFFVLSPRLDSEYQIMWLFALPICE